jgi:hypothetical protein
MRYRQHFPPVPADFPAVFIKGGHRLAERMFGCSTPVLNKWIEWCERDGRLRADRAAVQPCGPRVGAVVNRVRVEG